VDARHAELGREVATMHKHKEAQEGCIGLNIGGYRFGHTFFDAYFSGRYAQDVCDDGSIFVDRDGEQFGHVLWCLWWRPARVRACPCCAY
jgi:hypothetical protein